MAGTTFSTGNWTGYDEQSATNPSGALTDFTLLIDISTLSSTWKSEIQSDGGDIRVTKGDDTELAYDLIDFAYNAGAPTGWIRCKWSGSLASSGTQNVRVWAGYTGGTAVAYDANETYGSDNAYDSNWVGYWPLHETPSSGATFADRTSNGNDGTLTDADSSTTSGTGKVGACLNFSGSTADRIECGNSLLGSANGTILAWCKPDNNSAYYGVAGTRTGDSDECMLGVLGAAGANTGESWGPSWSNRLESNAALSTSALSHVGISINSTGPARNHWYNGASSANDANTHFSTFTADFEIGSRGANSLGFDGLIDDVQLHSVARAAEWIAEEYAQSNSQSTFWGTWAWTSGTYETLMATAVVHDALNGSSVGSIQGSAGFTTGGRNGMQRLLIDSAVTGQGVNYSSIAYDDEYTVVLAWEPDINDEQRHICYLNGTVLSHRLNNSGYVYGQDSGALASSTTQPTLSTTNTLIIRRDLTSLQVYLNGSLIAEDTTVSTIGTGSGTLTLGNNNGILVSRNLLGKLGEFGYFDYKFSDGDRATYDAGPTAGGEEIEADAGGIEVGGGAATLPVTRNVDSAAGGVEIAGGDATLPATRKVTADAGAITVTGGDATLPVTRKITADAGAIELSGGDATLDLSSNVEIDAGAGAIELTGGDATLPTTRRIDALAGAIELTGGDASLVITRSISCGAGAIELTGSNTTLPTTRRISCDAGVIVITGRSTTLAVTGEELLVKALNVEHIGFAKERIEVIELNKQQRHAVVFDSHATEVIGYE